MFIERRIISELKNCFKIHLHSSGSKIKNIDIYLVDTFGEPKISKLVLQFSGSIIKRGGQIL